ncbi:MAG: RHS repeat-associated core domain-containing protein, partial [Bacteroidota bacterium]
HKDHLGNVRLTFSDLDQDGAITVGSIYDPTNEIVLEKHYYPFGMDMTGAWFATVAPDNAYRYNGKELEEATGLYDYGARYYDPAVARWGQVDPLAEGYYAISPYTYVANNPLIYIDPTGAIIEDTDDIVKNHKANLNESISHLEDFIGSGMVSAELGNKLIGVNRSMLKDIKKLERSEQVYKVFDSGDGVEGGLQYGEKGAINIGIGSGANNYNGLVAHELEHAMQYERGEISIVTDNSDYGVLYDITDETNAFNQERRIGMGIGYFTDPSAVFTDADVRAQGATMTPPAYQSLPSGPININSPAGKALRQRTEEAGRTGQQVYEVYMGWQRDYAKSAKKRN